MHAKIAAPPIQSINQLNWPNLQINRPNLQINTQQIHGGTILDPDMTQYDAILEPVMVTQYDD